MALIAGLILNLLIRSLAALLTLAATSVRAGFRQSPNGSTIFLWLAGGVLLFSFTPDIALLVFRLYPETTLGAVLTLMSMHVVSAALCMTLLALPARKA